MTVNISYTEVAYSVYRPDDDNPEIARRCGGAVSIYNGRATSARIAREIPKGATVESVGKIDKSFDVDGEKALAWLIENGTVKE